MGDKMKYLLTGCEMKVWERKMMEKYHTPSLLLMERAAIAVTEELFNGSYDLHKVLIVCGTGNNGGDGIAVARLLTGKKISVDVLLLGEPERMTPETSQQMKMYQAISGKMVTEVCYDEYTVIVDAVLGIGCNREVTGKTAAVVEAVNQATAPVISIDVPSGISCDTGKVCGIAVKADVTITFFMKKLGMVLYPGREFCGKVKVEGLGLPIEAEIPENSRAVIYEQSDLPKLPKRSGNSHKGSYGKVLVIAGSTKISGAAYLSAAAAYRIGAGLVKIYTPEENRTAMQMLLPEALLEIYDRKQFDREDLLQCIKWADVIVAGPGMGTDPAAKEILETILKYSDLPLVLDADALNLLSGDLQQLKSLKSSVILTPHIQEMARLTGEPREEIKEHSLEKAAEFVENYPVVLVLKDAATIVAKKEELFYVNTTGNSGMATGGSGDVLAGILGGLLAQGMNELEAARLGVYLHGAAGDAMLNQKSAYSIMASDLLEGIAEVTNI